MPNGGTYTENEENTEKRVLCDSSPRLDRVSAIAHLVRVMQGQKIQGHFSFTSQAAFNVLDPAGLVEL